MTLRDGYGWDTVNSNARALRADGVPQANALAAAYAHGRVCFFRSYPHGALPHWLAFPRIYRLREHYDKSGAPLKVSQREYADNPGAPILPDGCTLERKVYLHPYKQVFWILRNRHGYKLGEFNTRKKAIKHLKMIEVYMAAELDKPGEKYADNPAAPNQRRMEQAAQLYEDFTGKKATRISKHSLPELPREGLVFGKLIQVGYESARDGRPYRHTFRERSRPLLVATPDGKTVLIVGGRYAFTDRGIEDR